MKMVWESRYCNVRFLF